MTRLGALLTITIAAAAAGTFAASHASQQATQPRARDLGVAPGVFTPGPLNAITDVADVRVGHVTLVEGDRVRTGVTAIVPHGGNVFQDKVAGGVFVGNAFGKLAGSTQVDELGTIETPIVLTNTLAVGTAVEAVVRHTVAQPGNEQVRSVNALVGETNDGGLNDIRALPVTGDHVRRAIDGARTGPVEEGAVGAGTGTVCYGWKGGIGTSSRIVPRGREASAGSYTLGVIVQTNFGGHLTIDGVPVWKTIGRGAFAFAAPGWRAGREADALADGSCMIVIATDAPLSARDLQRLAARGVFGLARTGSSYSHGSGDFAIAFSTAADVRTKFGERDPRPRAILPSDGVSALFQAALEATEEAVYNSLFQARTMAGNGRTVEALPLDRVKALLDARAR
jgi:D-aminopeptidase